MPLERSTQWVAFAGLLVANNGLLTAGRATSPTRRRSGPAPGPRPSPNSNAPTRVAAGPRRERRPARPTPRPGQGSGHRRRAPPAGRRDPRHHRPGPDRHHRPAPGRREHPRPGAGPRAHLDRAADLARHSLGEARRSVHNLAPVGPGARRTARGAEARRSTEWARTDRRTRRVHRHRHRRARCTTRSSATLLRIAQEALSNAARHAGAPPASASPSPTWATRSPSTSATTAAASTR